MGRLLSHWDRQETTVLRRKRLKKVPLSAPQPPPRATHLSHLAGRWGFVHLLMVRCFDSRLLFVGLPLGAFRPRAW